MRCVRALKGARAYFPVGSVLGTAIAATRATRGAATTRVGTLRDDATGPPVAGSGATNAIGKLTLAVAAEVVHAVARDALTALLARGPVTQSSRAGTTNIVLAMLLTCRSAPVSARARTATRASPRARVCATANKTTNTLMDAEYAEARAPSAQRTFAMQGRKRRPRGPFAIMTPWRIS